MKKYFLLTGLLLVVISYAGAQVIKEQHKDTLNSFTGLYHMSIDSSQQFRIKRDKDQLILEVTGQGQTTLTHLQGNRFSPDHMPLP